MQLSNNQEVFLSLLRAGLWEKPVRLVDCAPINFEALSRLAEEQAVTGLVAAGFEFVSGYKMPPEEVLQFAGQALQLEQRNIQMNQFIAELVEKVREEGINTLLVKGQGIAQCYERPLWRASGDVDLFLDEENYKKAKEYLSSKATSVDDELEDRLHLAMTIDSWDVELHGSLRHGLWKRFDTEIDKAQDVVFRERAIRSWMNGNTEVYLPRADEDILFVFAHILQHFFQGGIGLRQICDWCRLIWTFRERIDFALLESRLKSAGVMSEWRAFASFSVDYLGMPVEAMPFYSVSPVWSRKAKRIMSFVLETGNFGHNRDYSYYTKYPFLIYKWISFWRHTKDAFHISYIFPIDSIKVWFRMIKVGIKVIIR